MTTTLYHNADIWGFENPLLGEGRTLVPRVERQEFNVKLGSVGHLSTYFGAIISNQAVN